MRQLMRRPRLAPADAPLPFDRLEAHAAHASWALQLHADAVQFARAALRAAVQPPRGATELLYSFGGLGIQVRLGRSEAANISPWMIRVEYLSRSRRDTAPALCALDCGQPLSDATGELAPE